MCFCFWSHCFHRISLGWAWESQFSYHTHKDDPCWEDDAFHHIYGEAVLVPTFVGSNVGKKQTCHCDRDKGIRLNQVDRERDWAIQSSAGASQLAGMSSPHPLLFRHTWHKSTSSLYVACLPLIHGKHWVRGDVSQPMLNQVRAANGVQKPSW